MYYIVCFLWLLSVNLSAYTGLPTSILWSSARLKYLAHLKKHRQMALCVHFAWWVVTGLQSSVSFSPYVNSGIHISPQIHNNNDPRRPIPYDTNCRTLIGGGYFLLIQIVIYTRLCPDRAEIRLKYWLHIVIMVYIF